MLNELISWWLERMGELLPARLTRGAAGPRQALVVTIEGPIETTPVALLVRRRQRREIPLGRFALDESGLRDAKAALGNRDRGTAVVLRLPPGLVLEREVVLPLAAEREVARVVRYEMDRFSPFSAEEVFWTYAIRRRDRASGRLVVLVSLAPKARLETALAALAGIGVAPAQIEAPLPGGALRQIGLGQPDTRRQRLRRLGVGAMAGGCAALALAAVVIPFVRQAAALQAAEAQIAELKPRVDQVEALRKRMAADNNGADVLAAEGARVGDMLQALAAITDLLPDDTFLNALSLRGRKVLMDGQSNAAARLIAALSSDPVIRNAAFAAPVTRTVTGADAFSIRAELGP